MTLFRLDASIMPATSASREIADIVEQQWTAAHPDDEVIRRHVGSQPLPAEAWADAVSAGFTPEDQRSEGQQRALALAAELVEELTSADAVLLAVPLYNFGVSQHVKAWIDLVIAGSGPGATLLAGKPVVLATVRGGSYAVGTPREGWDHSTDYLRRVLADVWGGDLTVVEREFTLVGVNPALDAFKDQAAEMQTEALSAAREAGRALGLRAAA
ncbi:MAG: FMN-dependent NADH-azoreductase [Marmoricola sp.]|nr:FMN-dependent NADH-azoreductase [Marmoricola sp.]